MKTVEQVIRYIEGRIGGRYIKGQFVPNGGGLYALELLAEEKGMKLDVLLYRAQHAELLALLVEITNANPE